MLMRLAVKSLLQRKLAVALIVLAMSLLGRLVAGGLHDAWCLLRGGA